MNIFSIGAGRGFTPFDCLGYHQIFLTELWRKALNHAMDIHAGCGIQLGPRNYLGLAYQAGAH